VPGRTAFHLDIPPHVAEGIRHLPPDVKHGVKAALRSLSADPHRGVPLRRELERLHKYRVRRFRIVYSIHQGKRLLRVVAVGHRRDIYDVVSSLVHRGSS
jgi:mRNA interferase RelE/StbE